MRNAQQARQWRIFHLLWYTKRGLSAEDIHAALDPDVHMKTIVRDMEAVAHGFPAVQIGKNKGRIVIRLEYGSLLEVLSAKPDIALKVCINCRKRKSLDDYHNCRSYPDGKWPECKICRNAYNKQFYDANYKRERIWKRGEGGMFVKTTGKRRRRKYELKETK